MNKEIANKYHLFDARHCQSFLKILSHLFNINALQINLDKDYISLKN